MHTAHLEAAFILIAKSVFNGLEGKTELRPILHTGAARHELLLQRLKTVMIAQKQGCMTCMRSAMFLRSLSTTSSSWALL
jgi:hypothetical protein